MSHTHEPTRHTPWPRRFASLCLAAALLALGAGGCDGGETGETGTTTTTQDQSGCTNDPRVEAYAAGMKEMSQEGAMSITLLDADPAPPSKGDNVWMLKVEDDAGNPVDGATITMDATMPDHGHSSTVVPDVASKGGGTYELDPINLFMPGVWQVTFDVAPPSGAVQSTTFTFCVQG